MYRKTPGCASSVFQCASWTVVMFLYVLICPDMSWYVLIRCPVVNLRELQGSLRAPPNWDAAAHCFPCLDVVLTSPRGLHDLMLQCALEVLQSLPPKKNPNLWWFVIAIMMATKPRNPKSSGWILVHRPKMLGLEDHSINSSESEMIPENFREIACLVVWKMANAR